MATPKRLDFSELTDDGASPSSRKRKPDTIHAEEEKKRKSKKKKSASGVTNRVWSEDDEFAILKGLADYRSKTRSDPKIDWDGFYNSIKASLQANVSKEQLLSKARKLKKKFIVHMERISQGKDPLFTRSFDSQAFGYAQMIWDQNEDKGGMEKAQQTECCVDEQVNIAEPVNEVGAEQRRITAGNEYEFAKKGMENIQQTLNGEDEPVDDYEPVKEDGTEKKKVTPGNEFANKSVEKAQKIMNGEAEPVGKDALVNENGAGTSKSDGVLDKTTEYKTAGKESQSHEGDGDDADADADAEEFGAVRDAFESMLSQGLSGYQKKVQVEKLMNVEIAKMKELSNEWKAICGEEERLKIRKFRLSAKLVEAANDGMK